MAQRLWVLRLTAVWALSCASIAASGCATGMVPTEMDAPPMRPDVRIDARPPDAPPVDAPGTDAPIVDAPIGDAPGSCVPACPALSRCDMGTCMPYPNCRPDDTCPNASDICRNRRCIPRTDDPDGDGSPASEDCDESNPARNPDAPEICNRMDEDCNGASDDGDPAEMCEMDPAGGVCLSGTCGCPPGVVDIDRTVAGCECTISPATGMGATCAGAIDLGALNDGAAGSSGASMTAVGNALPLGREVWYTVRANDSADTTCDNFHFRAQLTVNPDNAFEIAVTRGVCGDAISCDGATPAVVDYSWATDFRGTRGTELAGECPCGVPGRMDGDNISNCSDNSATYLVRVRRVTGAAASCSQYTLEVSNGLYSEM